MKINKIISKINDRFRNFIKITKIRAVLKYLRKIYKKILSKIIAIIPPLKNTYLRRVIFALIGLSILYYIFLLVSSSLAPQKYDLGSAELLLPKTNLNIASSIKSESDAYTYDAQLQSNESLGSKSQASSSVIYKDPSKGVTITDNVNKISFSLKPTFDLGKGVQKENRIVFPIDKNESWAVYTVQASGVKEDIILTKPSGDIKSYEYTLGLGNSLEARIENDGSIGIYGNTLLSGSVTTASDSDAALLEKARNNAKKDKYLFGIPKPTVIGLNGVVTTTNSKFELSGDKLKVIVSGLENASYPLSIDPSIYVATAQQFMNGNNETNINFNVEDQLIEKSHTTGARFNDWNATLSLNTSTWRQGAVASGGYIYTVGGVHPNDGTVSYTSPGSTNFVVPDGITSITVKAWGGGGGGGGGGNSQPGGAGGGAGFVQSTISVTPGETLTVYVGGGGGGGPFSSGGNDAGGGGGGGGYSSIYRSSTPLAIASGGGGGGGGRQALAGAAGGAGGGTTGISGGSIATNNGLGGAGGSQSAGGTAGASTGNDGTSGSSLTGGAGGDGRTNDGADGSAANAGSHGGGSGGSPNINTTRAGGGGGGGGYFGGGGGGATSSVTTAAGGGGGGGSGYITGSSTSNTSGSGTTPGNSSDANRGSAGNGGSGGAALGNGNAGSGGAIIISYTSVVDALDTVNWAKLSTTTGEIESANPGNGVCSGWCTSTSYNLPSPRSSLSLVAYNGFLYAMGGESSTCTTGNGTGDGGICDTVYVAKIGANGEPQLWHPTDTNKTNWVYWYRDTDLSSPRSQTSAVAYNNRIYLLGGKTSTSGTPSVVSSVQIADLTATGKLGSWSTSSNTLPYNSYGHDAQVYNNRLYLIGGASSIGGAPLSSTYYSKINNDGTINTWIASTSFSGGRMTNGGNFSTIWGGYLYLSGGCSSVNGSGYCTSVDSSTQLASINADGTLDEWNTNASVSDSRMGHSLTSWRNYLYEIGGCTTQNTSTGSCSSALDTINYGEVNQDGDASTVNQSVASGTGECIGSNPYNCNLPSTGIGNVLNGTAIVNGYLYILGGCTNNACTTVSNGVAYIAIGSDGTLVRPATCTGSYQDSFCISSTNLPSSVGAPGITVFNDRIYVVGGFPSVNNIYYTTVDSATGAISAWSTTSLTGIGATNVSYTYAYSRANPSQANTYPGNLYIMGGCTSPTAVGCGNYTGNVYKCNIDTSGVPSACSTSGQLQIGTVPGASSAGIGAHAGTVYANYVYLIGGLAPGLSDMDSVRYAKIDNNNNIVTIGSGWTESPNKTSTGRRRGAAFGYNGYLYVTGGYDGTSGGGVLADIEFSKINVTDGSINPFSISTVTINQRWGLSVPVSNSFAYVVGGCTVGAAPSSCTTRTNTIQTFQIYNNDSGAPAEYKAPESTTCGTQSGNAKFDRYDGIGAGTAISDLYSSGIYPNSPSSTSTISGSNLSGPSGVADNYGGRLSALICAPQTGNYRFWVASDDNSELRLSTSTSSSSVSVVASVVGGWTNVNEWTKYGTQQSSDVYLEAGHQYYIEANYKEGTGGDHVEIGWTLPDTTVERPIPNSRYSLPTEVSPQSVFTVDPDRIGASATVLNGFIYAAGGCTTITCTATTDNVQVAPINISDGSIGSWSSAGTLPAKRAYGKLLNAGGSLYYVGGFTPCSAQSGQSKFDRYNAIGGGTAITDLYSSGIYPNSPSSTQTLTGSTLSSLTDIADSFGGRLSALICAPQSGNYRLWVASDDDGDLRISTDTSIANISSVATVSGYTNVNEWTKYGSQQSGDIYLVGGRQYYIEANYKEGGGGDHVEIGWTLPDATVERPIPNTRYSLPTDIMPTGGNQSSVFYVTPNANGTLPSWSTASNGLPSARSNFGATVWNNRLYVVGGDSDSGIQNTVYVSPQLNSGGNITSAWSTSTGFNVARSGATAIAYANNLYVLGGYNGTNYLSDTQFAKISTSDGSIPSWSYSESLPGPIAQADGFAANGYIYLIGGRSSSSSCSPSTLVAPISANTSISSGNNPTGIGKWYETNVRYAGDRYGASAVYNDGTAFVIGGGCSSFVGAADRVTYTTLLSQPQVARYSVMIDTDSDVFPTSWLLNGVDNSIGAKWQLKYRSMTNTTTSCTSPAMTTWGLDTYFGDVTLGLPGVYTPKNSSGTNTNCARFFYFSVGVDSSKAYGYPDDVTRGPTINDLTLQFTADPSKRLMHGRTFTGGIQQPIDTPYYSF